mmetsp:Transcript_18822/g.54446  ORF Transcript_18822/g.54446 Transcript_18822/m.54446 type:complete len:207 (-) Transcript_18822:689-1309(-)
MASDSTPPEKTGVSSNSRSVAALFPYSTASSRCGAEEEEEEDSRPPPPAVSPPLRRACFSAFLATILSYTFSRSSNVTAILHVDQSYTETRRSRPYTANCAPAGSTQTDTACVRFFIREYRSVSNLEEKATPFLERVGGEPIDAKAAAAEEELCPSRSPPSPSSSIPPTPPTPPTPPSPDDPKTVPSHNSRTPLESALTAQFHRSL